MCMQNCTLNTGIAVYCFSEGDWKLISHRFTLCFACEKAKNFWAVVVQSCQVAVLPAKHLFL